jgi:hypothetical protein
MLVMGKPDGDVRICLNPSELKKAIQRQHFVVPTMNQLFAKIGKSKYFCSSGVASGCYQVPLIEERRSTKKSCPNCLGIFPMLKCTLMTSSSLLIRWLTSKSICVKCSCGVVRTI